MVLRRKKRLFGAGLGAGLLGAIILALRYAVLPVSKARLPDSISPAIFRTKALHTTVGQIVYHESGSGPTVVFIHSICPGASSYEWSKVYPVFTGSHRVLAPDLVGFGESARPDANLSAADYVKSLAEFIRGTCDEPVILVASGLGGGLAVLLATQHPELVRQLLLWMPTGLTEFGMREVSISRRLASMAPLVHRFVYRNYESSRAAVRGWLGIHGFVDPSRITDESVEVYSTCAQQYGAEHAIRNLCAGRLNVALEDRLPMLSQPVTLLWPDPAPDFIPSDLAARLQALTKGGRLRFASCLSRLAAIEAPAEIAALLAEELDPGPKLVH
jgi:pimeloyl-ACP methyl ester carboxylesterase